MRPVLQNVETMSCFHTMLSLCKVQYGYNSRCLMSGRVVLHDYFSSLKETTHIHKKVESVKSEKNFLSSYTMTFCKPVRQSKYYYKNGWEDKLRALFEFWQLLAFFSQHKIQNTSSESLKREKYKNNVTGLKSAVYQH